MEEFWVSPYLREWDLLADIASEWAAIRGRFGLGSKATHEQIDAHYDAIFRTHPPEWPALRRLIVELTRDKGLQGYIRCVYQSGLHPHQRRNRSADLVINAVLYRLVWCVARRAKGWLQDRTPDTRRNRSRQTHQNIRHSTVRDDQVLEHWGRFLGWRAMLTEIERAIDNMSDESPSGDIGLSDSPEPFDSGSLSPDDRASILEMAEARLTRKEMAVFLDCMRVAWGDTDDTNSEIAKRKAEYDGRSVEVGNAGVSNAEIASRHGISEEEVADILIRGLSDPNRK